MQERWGGIIVGGEVGWTGGKGREVKVGGRKKKGGKRMDGRRKGCEEKGVGGGKG